MTATPIKFTDTKGRTIEVPADQIEVKRAPGDRWYVVTRVGSHWIVSAEAMRLTAVLAGS